MAHQPSVYSSSHSQASTSGIPRISGSVPGVLDPTQPARLLRVSGAKLSFASFDPRVVSVHGVPDLRKLSLNEELYRPKRVVIETMPSGESHWRFVPSARRAEGVGDEGQWPRVISICGESVECTLDQWDIYKLDPMYECHVYVPPALSTISLVGRKTYEAPLSPGKRQLSSPSSMSDELNPSPVRRRRKERAASSSSRSSPERVSAESDEVEGMVVDNDARSKRPPGRAGKTREHTKKKRQARREMLAQRLEQLAQRQKQRSFAFDISQKPPGSYGREPSKRKVDEFFGSSLRNAPQEKPAPSDYDIRNNVIYTQTARSKRTRTVSPSSAKHTLEQKRLERETKKQERRERERLAQREERERRYMEELLADSPEQDGFEQTNGSSHSSQTTSSEQSTGYSQESDTTPTTMSPKDMEDGARAAAIEESRRKIAELEADRPLWEEYAKQRKRHEEQEAEQERVAGEARRLARAEEERKARIRHAEEEARAKEAAAQRERDKTTQREEKARREREQRRKERWSFGPWTPTRALERYKVLCDYFDNTKFTEQEPLAVDLVPWPTLHAPSTFAIENVDWAAVEKFFDAVKPHMRLQDFKSLVEKSHRRFHPDRWRSRCLLKSVTDDTERNCMEVAANTVAQALTPIWMEVTGR